MKVFFLIIVSSLSFTCFAQIPVTAQPNAAPLHSAAETVLPEDYVYKLNTIDKKPEFPGGDKEFYRFFNDEFEVPGNIRKKENKIIMTMIFIIEKDGSVSDIKAEIMASREPVGDAFINAAVKALKKMPKWKPAEINSKPVRVKIVKSHILNIGKLDNGKRDIGPDWP